VAAAPARSKAHSSLLTLRLKWRVATVLPRALRLYAGRRIMPGRTDFPLFCSGFGFQARDIVLEVAEDSPALRNCARTLEPGAPANSATSIGRPPHPAILSEGRVSN
jgi:hypothetical protein